MKNKGQKGKHEIKKEKQKYMISEPTPERYLFVVGSRAGYPVLFVDV